MKKILIISLLLILSSCSIDWNWEKDKRIAEQNNKITILEKQIQDFKKENENENDLFKKKQECAKYQDEIIKELKNPDFIMKELDPVIEQIFYSPVMKTCLYSFRYLKWDYCNRDDLTQELSLSCLHKDKSIVDYFTKEEIYSSIKYDNCIKNWNFNNCVSIDEKIQELKWE